MAKKKDAPRDAVKSNSPKSGAKKTNPPKSGSAKSRGRNMKDAKYLELEVTREETDAIREHYNADPLKEWNRLKTEFPYEKYITTHMMDRYISKQKHSQILDIGGGPGHYSIHYAREGHDVTLLDLSDENVRFAKKKARQYKTKITAMQGNALDLSRFPDDSFDVVFLMGPLYHLMEEENRVRAIEEAKRVLKPGGYLFSSFILLYGGVVYGLREVPETITMEQDKLQVLFGATADDISVSFEAFTYAFMTNVADARALLDGIAGLRTECVFGQESILSPYRNVLRAYPRKVQQAWYDYAIRFCDKEEYLTHTEHLMIVSVKEK